jgi:hypothetical protein
MPRKRIVSDEYITRVYRQLKTVRKTARRIGYTEAGTYRALYRLGLRKQ